MSSLTTVLIFSTLGGILSLFLAVVLIQTPRRAKLLAKYATPFAAGALLSAAFLDLLRESVELDGADSAMMWALAGIVAFFILESLLGWFHHHHEHPENEKRSAASLVIIGDSIHNLLDGIAIGAAFIADYSTGVVTTIAVASHEIPQEVGDFGLLLKHGFNRAKVLWVNLFSALATVVGAVITFQLGSEGLDSNIGWLLAITAGFFIYIAASDVIPGIHRTRNRRSLLIQSVLVLAGVIFVGLITEISHNSIEEPHNDIHIQELVQTEEQG